MTYGKWMGHRIKDLFQFTVARKLHFVGCEYMLLLMFKSVVQKDSKKIQRRL
jgi:hypothetical protein